MEDNERDSDVTDVKPVEEEFVEYINVEEFPPDDDADGDGLADNGTDGEDTTAGT